MTAARLSSISRPTLGAAFAFACLTTGAGAQTAAPNRTIPAPPAEEVARVDAALPAKARVAPGKPRRLLMSARTEGFYHVSIPIGLHALKQLGERTGAYSVEVDHEMSAFTAEELAGFDAILLLSTTQLAFSDAGARAALLGFVEDGKGLIGIHAASDNFPTWPEGQALMGGVFHSHPWVSKDVVAVKLDEPDHPINAAFGGSGFWIRDEIYQIVGPYGRDRQRVLMSLDMARPENDRPADKLVREDRDFPIGWLKKHGGGRVFYSSLGHNSEVFWTTEVLQHWLDGIQFALGDLEAPAAPSSTVVPRPKPAQAPALPQTLLDRADRRDAAGALAPANLDAVASYTDGQDPRALQRLEAALRGPESAKAKSALPLLAERADLTPDAKRVVIDWLADFGGDASLPRLAAWAADPATADAAVRAVAKIPGTDAERTLIGLLRSAPAAHRISVVDALGQRRAAAAADVIAADLRSGDPDSASAALDALSRIASKDALSSLRDFKPAEGLSNGHTWALLNAARTLEQDGDKRGATRLVRDVIRRAGISEAHRVAAFHAWLRLDPAAAVPQAAALLSSPYVGVRLTRAWILTALESTRSEKHLTSLAADFGKLPGATQRTLLAHAGQLADPRLAPIARAALASADAEIRHAAFSALAACGNLKDSGTLVAALARPEDRDAAADALARQPLEGLEDTLRALVPNAASEVKASLLMILGRRLDREAMPLMLEAAAGADRAPRAAAYRGLAELARGDDLPLILSLREKVQPADRRYWQEALRAAVRGRNDVPETVSLLRKELDAASSAERPAFLAAIIGFETEDSLEAIRALLNSPDTERRKEMVRALSAARNQTSFDLLIGVAETDTDEAVRTLALRGYLDTLAGRRDRWSETIQAYGRAGRAALRPEEREAAIAALTGFDGSESSRVIAELQSLPPLPGS